MFLEFGRKQINDPSAMALRSVLTETVVDAIASDVKSPMVPPSSGRQTASSKRSGASKCGSNKWSMLNSATFNW
jgi:hypothetical protein